MRTFLRLRDWWQRRRLAWHIEHAATLNPETARRARDLYDQLDKLSEQVIRSSGTTPR